MDINTKLWEPGSAICRCSFCGRSQNDVARLVASNTSCTAICADCTVRVVEVLISGTHESEEPSFTPTPAGRALAAPARVPAAISGAL